MVGGDVLVRARRTRHALVRRRRGRGHGRRLRRSVRVPAARGVRTNDRRDRADAASWHRRAAARRARRGIGASWVPASRLGGARRQRRSHRAVRRPRIRADRAAQALLPTERDRRDGDAKDGAGMSNAAPIVLGIETSCDETGVGIVRGSTLLADALASSVDEHARFGGVVPEVASRAHLEAMVPTMHRALEQAGLSLKDIDAIAVTSGPGLAGALLVGVAAAKAYALALNKPLYGVHHLAAHVAVERLADGNLPEPCVALLVSGGHTSLLLVPDVTGPVEHLGQTVDDAAGEAFDKVARVLGLPFPGGPHIDRAATDGDKAAIDFPRGVVRDAPY